MDLETIFKENYVSLPMHLQLERCLQPSIKDILPFGNPSSNGFLQDLHHIDHVNVNVSSSNPIQTPNFDAFDNFTVVDSSPNFDVNECKPFVENNSISGHAHVMDNFLYGSCNLNIRPRNQLDMMASNLSFLPYNPQETKPSNFVAPDEVSRISPLNYFKRVGMIKNNKARKKSNVVKGQWTTEEDGYYYNSQEFKNFGHCGCGCKPFLLLIQLVEQYGLRKWSQVAKILPGRIGKQCRERWHNHLRPNIKKDIWTDEEDKILIETHAKIGNKWAEIAKRLPGRTENSIKNHWNATKRRQYSKRKCRTKYPRGTLLQEYITSLNLDKNPPIDYRKKSSINYANALKNKTITSKVTAPPLPQTAYQFCATDDCLAPNYNDFNMFPDFFFGENLFEEGCSIHSLLNDEPCEGQMQCDSIMEGKHCDEGGMKCAYVNVDENHVETEMPLEMMLEIEVKKELDLVEMMSKINNEIDYV